MTTDPGVIAREDVFGSERHALELARVFGRSWLFVGHESEIPSVGDWVTRSMAGDSVVLVRALDGQPRVLLNSCAHRGTQLCRADTGRNTRFRCMYHGWTYDTEGELRGVPGLRANYPPDFDRAEHGLRRARVESHAGLIFATWDEEALPLAKQLGDFTFYLDALFARAGDGWEVVGPPLRWRSQTNWKISVENFGMDSLHLGVLHEGTGKLGIFGATEDEPTVYSVSCDGGHVIEATKLPSDELAFPGYPDELWPEFVAHLNPTQAWFAANNLVCKGNVFPNLSFIDLYHDYTGDPEAPAVAATMLRLAEPLGPSESDISMWILVPKSAPAQWKRWSQESLVRTLGPAGTFEPDDLENTSTIAAANAGRHARSGNFVMTAGTHFQPSDAETAHGLPGVVYVAKANTETMQRAFFAELNRLVAT